MADNTSTIMPSPVPEPVSRLRLIMTGVVGNVMKWYDFAIYGFLAPVIGQLFFPSDDPASSIIAAFGALSAVFLVRPLGAVILGRMGDLIGRGRALLVSMFLMAVPTVLIGLLPTYQTIGILAPVGIIFLRVIQGLSVGGEYSTSIVYLVENSPQKQRGFSAIWGPWGAVAGTMLGSMVGAFTTNHMTEASLLSWGWRIPFLLSGILALSGVLIRRQLTTHSVPVTRKNPLRACFGEYRKPFMAVAMLYVGLATTFYTVFVYAVTYLQQIDHLPEKLAFRNNSKLLLMLLIFMPFMAMLSDKIGRRPFLIIGSGLVTLGAIPFFHMMHHTNPPAWVLAGEFGFAVGYLLLASGLAASSVELMPREIRCTGLGLALNIPTALLGGTAPLIASLLIKWTGNPFSPGWYAAFGAGITLIAAVFLIRETFDKEIS